MSPALLTLANLSTLKSSPTTSVDHGTSAAALAPCVALTCPTCSHGMVRRIESNPLPGATSSGSGRAPPTPVEVSVASPSGEHQHSDFITSLAAILTHTPSALPAIACPNCWTTFVTTTEKRARRNPLELTSFPTLMEVASTESTDVDDSPASLAGSYGSSLGRVWSFLSSRRSSNSSVSSAGSVDGSVMGAKAAAGGLFRRPSLTGLFG